LFPPVQSVWLASHDTPGARAAEEAALALLPRRGTLRHLVVVPEFWRGMRGDDWLNNAITQIRFGDYVEDQILRDIGLHVRRLSEAAAARDILYQHEIRVGKPAPCLIACCARDRADLVVVGSRRPRGTGGYRSRLDLEALTAALAQKLLVVPHPGR
jgi:nucleotide-binding universal stress UspA family protein